MTPESGRPAADPSLRAAAKWIALILFVLYSLDLVWKLAHWSQYAAGMSLRALTVLLFLRLLFMAFLLLMYLRARKTT